MFRTWLLRIISSVVASELNLSLCDDKTSKNDRASLAANFGLLELRTSTSLKMIPRPMIKLISEQSRWAISIPLMIASDSDVDELVTRHPSRCFSKG